MQTFEKFPVAPNEAILCTDRRGMQTLASACSPVAWEAMAHELLAASRNSRVLLCTGFPVNGRPETDGPPGTLILATALCQLGGRIALVSLPAVLDGLSGLMGAAQIEMISAQGGTAGERVEGVPVTVEVCGRTEDGTYRNMRGVDITSIAPWIESIVGDEALISVGDGGNEYGFGSAPRNWFDKFSVRQPVSRCRYLVPAEVSNWGALAIVAALQRATGEPLMPDSVAYQSLLDELALRGMVDGFSGLPSATEDGLKRDAAKPVIEALTQWAIQADPGRQFGSAL